MFAGYITCKKLHALKDNTKMWNREVFGWMDEHRETLSKFMEDLDKEGERQDLSLKEVADKQAAVRRTWYLDGLEKISWRQNPELLGSRKGIKKVNVSPPRYCNLQ